MKQNYRAVHGNLYKCAYFLEYILICSYIMNFLLVLSGGIVQLRLLGYLIFCLKIDLRNTNLLRKNPINNNDQQHKNLAHSVFRRFPMFQKCCTNKGNENFFKDHKTAKYYAIPTFSNVYLIWSRCFYSSLLSSLLFTLLSPGLR